MKSQAEQNDSQLHLKDLSEVYLTLSDSVFMYFPKQIIAVGR